MFDSNFVSSVLPDGYSISERIDEYYSLSFGDIHIGSYYHYNEAIDAAVNHHELAEWKAANSHLYV